MNIKQLSIVDPYTMTISARGYEDHADCLEAAEEAAAELFAIRDHEVTASWTEGREEIELSFGASTYMLRDYQSGKELRPCTREEQRASRAAGDTGVIDVDGRSVYAEG